MNNFSIELTNFEQQQKTICNAVRMVKNRGWITEKKLNDFIKNFEDNNTNTYEIKLDVDLNKLDTFVYNNSNNEVLDNKLIIKFVNTKSTSVNNITKSILDKSNTSYFIIIFSGIHVTDKKFTNNRVEIFTDTFFNVDLFSHALSPRYEIIPSSEHKALMEEYILTKKSIQELLITDPAAKYLGLKKGQIVRIIRNNEENLINVALRIVT